MARLNEWQADPEKYERLAEPFESDELALVAARAFLGELATLREKYRIPELIVQYQLYVKSKSDDAGPQACTGGAGWGNQLYQCQLAKQAMDQEFDHLARVLEMISYSIPKAKRQLITDPAAERSE
jgi:hypothetical protein